MARGSSRGRTAKKPPLKARAKKFAFEGFSEKDRFGVFDPALRAWFVFAFMLAAVLAALGVADAGGRSGPAWGLAFLLVLAIAAAGFLSYRRIWRRPVERELLLRMAAEDDESRALLARLTRERAAGRHRPAEGSQQDRSADTPRKAF